MRRSGAPEQGVHDERREGVRGLFVLAPDELFPWPVLFPSPAPNGSKPAPGAYVW
ncbi:hypothetical protein HUT16_26405 [Kitasatospora sp. NA04385]|uniref:hypothetical protein n=1 Tax=Kitasatospora sp. NA04385 TaxID=2742135 RepID=UPI001590AF3B|nr:hypothetical protein [Kitasatospora sp. NA04385]QKW22132.1 hypothetical protein HUT16_26405 [Kitasatospora sp. NA04385]